ncbi:hypothetical protein SAMD00023353_3401210 [Rosellinia necatrix]|uniref:Uncharacterized protein n=1 Tax=Rosellinia necatrix TaxID=77044 RepID=A0A1W2TL70_ROSNE|nr:hypothetical protein SAMD00023353_3401210 [Rosellinia necatrix]
MHLFWEAFSSITLITFTFYAFLRRFNIRPPTDPELLQRFQRLQDRVNAVEQAMVQARRSVAALAADRPARYLREAE